jgi:hypothetical protein
MKNGNIIINRFFLISVLWIFIYYFGNLLALPIWRYINDSDGFYKNDGLSLNHEVGPSIGKRYIRIYGKVHGSASCSGKIIYKKSDGYLMYFIETRYFCGVQESNFLYLVEFYGNVDKVIYSKFED